MGKRDEESNSDQPRKKMKMNDKGAVPTDDYVYECEWDTCTEQNTDMAKFVKHISQHIAQYVVSDNVERTPNGTVFSCGWQECGAQIIGNLSDFNRHVYFHAFHVRIKCLGRALCISAGCTDGCSTDGLSRNSIPELPENLICGWKDCEIIYDNPVYFYSHVNQHIEEYGEGNNLKGGAKCKWAGCDTVVKSRYKLREHLRSHSQEKVIACPTCGGLYSNRTKFIDHQKRQADNSKQLYQCSHCNKRFATARILRDHMRHHVNHYKCPFCDMTCPSPSGLRSHIKYRHSQEKPFKCPHCDHSSKSSNDLRRHLECHSEASMFYCQEEGCEFESRTYNGLTRHVVKVHQNKDTCNLRYACHLCDKKVSRGTILTKHLKSTHKFKWPSGHSRFRYKLHDDNFWRLQTVRYESIEVSDHYVINSGASSPAPTDGLIVDDDELHENEGSEIAQKNLDHTENRVSYNLDLLGKVALQDVKNPPTVLGGINPQGQSDTSTTLQTIALGDLETEDQENSMLGMDRIHVANVSTSNHSMPLSDIQQLGSTNQVTVLDQSGSISESFSVNSAGNSQTLASDHCLDMPVL